MAAEKYGVAFGIGLGEVAGKVFRIGHLGSLTDVMALSGIATAEMVMADLRPCRSAWLRRRRGAGLLPQPRRRPAAGRLHDEDMARMHIPTFDDVLAAHERIGPHIHRTPVLTSRFLNDLTGAELFFKCENFQKAGAFKVRGASNAVFGLSEAEAAQGRRHPFERQPRAVAVLCRRAPGHSLHTW